MGVEWRAWVLPQQISRSCPRQNRIFIGLTVMSRAPSASLLHSSVGCLDAFQEAGKSTTRKRSWRSPPTVDRRVQHRGSYAFRVERTEGVVQVLQSLEQPCSRPAFGKRSWQQSAHCGIRCSTSLQVHFGHFPKAQAFGWLDFEGLGCKF